MTTTTAPTLTKGDRVRITGVVPSAEFGHRPTVRTGVVRWVDDAATVYLADWTIADLNECELITEEEAA